MPAQTLSHTHTLSHVQLAHCGYSEALCLRHINVRLTIACCGFPSPHPDAGLYLGKSGGERHHPPDTAPRRLSDGLEWL